MKMTVRASVCVRLRDPKLEEPKQSSLFTSSGAACVEFPPIKSSRHWVFFSTCSGDSRLEARLASTDGERSCSCVFSATLADPFFLVLLLVLKIKCAQQTCRSPRTYVATACALTRVPLQRRRGTGIHVCVLGMTSALALKAYGGGLHQFSIDNCRVNP